MQIDPATLRSAFVVLQDAHDYITHPTSTRPCESKRVATHRVPLYEFNSMERRVREALKALNDVMQADPVPT